MITKEKMLPMLVDACPSFTSKWEEHKREYYDEENFLPYIALAELARHVIDLHRENKTNEFENVFDVVEKFHIEGEHYVREAATIGFLEGIQNIVENNDLDPKIFYKFLKPESAKWWNELNKFWTGEIQFVGQTLNGKS
jgi:hypothetical protein